MTHTLTDLLAFIERVQHDQPQPHCPGLDSTGPPEWPFLRTLQPCDPPPPKSLERPELPEVRARIEAEIRAYLDGPPDHLLLIRAAPGTGKTTIAVDVAHQVAKTRRVMYCAPRHDFWMDIQKAVEFNRHDPRQWYEWLPRKDKDPQTCIHTESINKWMKKGYQAMDFCSGICGWDYVSNECPYHRQKDRKEPLVMCQHAHITVGHPIPFDILICDESPKNAFLNEFVIGVEDVIPKDMSNADPFKEVLSYLLDLCHNSEIISGPKIFTPLGPEEVAERCKKAEKIPLDAIVGVQKPRSIEEANNAGLFYIHKLAKLLGREARLAISGANYIPRIFAGYEKLGMLFRRPTNDRLPQYVVIMDATAHAHIYEALFQRPVRVVEAQPRLLGKVYQVYDRANGISAMVDKEGEKPQPTSKAVQCQRFVQQVIERYGYVEPATITFKDVEDMFDMSGHFYGARGTNAYQDCDAIFIVGAPMPNRIQLERVAAMVFFERDAPFNTAWHAANRKYAYVDENGDGRMYPVGGYWGDIDLETITSTYREDEILQAAHRIRPILGAKDIWLVTNIPIPDLPPHRLINMAEALDVPDGVNTWKWLDVLDAIEGQNVITTKQLMDLANLSRPTAAKHIKLLKQTGRWRDYDEKLDGELAVRDTGGRPPTVIIRN